MVTKTRDLIRLLGSGWMFRATILVFALETLWLAITSRFPMAFDEGYHFGLIQFFSHRLNPIVTSQPPDTYKFGALVQNSSLLYHYLMSFPYRIITLFTHDVVTQIVCLRILNIGLAVVGLLIIRKLLRLLRLSDALANLLVLMFALTPIVTDLSAQINYDNLLIPAVGLCMYQTVVFIRGLDKGRFDTKALLSLIVLCAFSSLIKFAFLPVLTAIAFVVIWRIARSKDRARLAADAKRNFQAMGPYTKYLLTIAAIVGSLLFVRFYVVDLVEYHNPVPQCNQVLNDRDCRHYYAWDNNYNAKRYNKAHPPPIHFNAVKYTGYWVIVNTLELFSVIFPLQGSVHIFTSYLVVVGMLGTLAFICTVVNFKRIFRDRSMRVLAAVSFIYLFSLWARNYHDYLQLGWPAAIDGRYIIPVLIYAYVFLASGFRYMLEEFSPTVARTTKTGLALVTIVSFLYLGGFHQYLHYIDPVYGNIDKSNDYHLNYGSS